MRKACHKNGSRRTSTVPPMSINKDKKIGLSLSLVAISLEAHKISQKKKKKSKFFMCQTVKRRKKRKVIG